jgi:hypothetical protein
VLPEELGKIHGITLLPTETAILRKVLLEVSLGSWGDLVSPLLAPSNRTNLILFLSTSGVPQQKYFFQQPGLSHSTIWNNDKSKGIK